MKTLANIILIIAALGIVILGAIGLLIVFKILVGKAIIATIGFLVKFIVVFLCVGLALAFFDIIVDIIFREPPGPGF